MATSTNQPTKRRLRREDWERAALDAIAREGLAGVAVEPLARRLGVTKGSFYAHFATRDELIAAALASWQQSHGNERLKPYLEIDDPAERLTEILRAATDFSQSGVPSVHISLLGELHDPRVREAVGRVTTSRLEFLTASFRELGLPPQRASHRARIAYASYVGLMQMARETPEGRLPPSEVGRFMKELRAVLVASS
jgi:AcrR family transcriptional regulator